MYVNTSPEGITTFLFMGASLLVLYTRIRNWLDSNIPPLFYTALVIYGKLTGDRIPFALICAGFALAMLLRFEFMNRTLTLLFKACEYCILAFIVFGFSSAVFQF